MKRVPWDTFHIVLNIIKKLLKFFFKNSYIHKEFGLIIRGGGGEKSQKPKNKIVMMTNFFIYIRIDTHHILLSIIILYVLLLINGCPIPLFMLLYK